MDNLFARSTTVLLDFWLTVKVTTLIFVCGRGLAILSALEGKLGFIYNLISLSHANALVFHENRGRIL